VNQSPPQAKSNGFGEFMMVVVFLAALYFGWQFLSVGQSANSGIRFLKSNCYSTLSGMQWDTSIVAIGGPVQVTEVELQIYDILGNLIDTVRISPTENLISTNRAVDFSYSRPGLVVVGKCLAYPKNLVGYIKVF
jgi:hypothetical protein